MPIIFKNKTCKIDKLSQQKYKLTILDGEKFKNFWINIKKKLKIIDDNKNNFTFEADNIITLQKLAKKKEKKLSYHHCELLFLDIGKQFEGLEKDGLCHLFLDDDDIILVDNDKSENNISSFLYLNATKVLPFTKDKVKINMPFKKDHLYLSPELSNIKSFPIEVSKKSTYYSLAMLVSNHLIPYKNKKKSMEIFKKHMESILESKLYWALLRCLEEDPDDRYYLYI